MSNLYPYNQDWFSSPAVIRSASSSKEEFLTRTVADLLPLLSSKVYNDSVYGNKMLQESGPKMVAELAVRTALAAWEKIQQELESERQAREEARRQAEEEMEKVVSKRTRHLEPLDVVDDPPDEDQVVPTPYVGRSKPLSMFGDCDIPHVSE